MNSLQYNTDREKLIIPEYGRHIHKMIQQVTEESDREKTQQTNQSHHRSDGELKPTPS